MSYIYTILLCSIAILLPWGRSIDSIGVFALAFIWLFSFEWKEKWMNIKESKALLLPFVLFFCSFLLGLTYSTDFQAGIEEVLRKLSFIILPVIIVSIYPKIERYFFIIKVCFVFSLLIYFLVSLFTAYSSYIAGNELAFYYIHLISFSKMHPSYISMYLILAIFFLDQEAAKRGKYVYILVIVFTIFVLLLSARAEILILLCALIVMMLYRIIVLKEWKMALAIASLVALFFIVSVYFLPELHTRFYALVKGEERKEAIIDIKNEREQLWSIAIKQIKLSPFIGIGTGSSAGFFMNEFVTNGFTKFEREKLNNAHNQYLQQMLSLGIAGIGSLVFMYLFIAWNSVISKNVYLFLFVFLVALASLTECVLETQSGIVFFSFFSILLLLENSKGKYDSHPIVI